MLPSSDGLPHECDVLVIGGGFYGLRLARLFALRGFQVVVYERGKFLERASLNNQARVHGGYHYPRSVLTAQRSREHYARFASEFRGAITSSFEHVYGIARQQTKVGAAEFLGLCKRIGAPVTSAPLAFKRHLDSNLIEDAFLVEEAVFDARALARQCAGDAVAAGAACAEHVEVLGVERGVATRFRVRTRSESGVADIGANWIINATYAGLNGVLRASALDTIPLIHELTEIVVVDPPPELRGYGVTIMDGPFWSCLPFPAFDGYSLTHVRYTPHAQWHSGEAGLSLEDVPDSHFPLMQRDAARFCAPMRNARYRSSRWEVKTVLPRSAGDDSRPILAHAHLDAPGLISVLGAKIDSVYDVEDELSEMISETAA